MADDDWNGVEVFLQVDGKDLPSYEAPDDELPVDIQRLRYVEANPGDEFAIVVRFPNDFNFHNADTVWAIIHIDGEKAFNQGRMVKELQTVKHNTTHFDRISHYDHGEETWKLSRVRFGEVDTTEDDTTGGSAPQTRDFGTITVRLSRGKAGPRERKAKVKDCVKSESFMPCAISESALKGKDINKRVVIDPGVIAPKAVHRCVTRLHGDEGEWRNFELRYRTRGQLLALGCLEPDAATIILDDHDSDQNANQETLPIDLDVPTSTNLDTPATGPLIVDQTPIKTEPQNQDPPDLIKTETIEEIAQNEMASVSIGTDQSKSALRARLESLDEELALVRERRRIQAQLDEAVASTSQAQGHANTPHIKRETEARTAVKREHDASEATTRLAKRTKPDVVDLTDD